MQERKPKYLAGVKRIVSDMLKRDLSENKHYTNEIFICDVCNGHGKYYRGSKSTSETCTHCEGTGRIVIHFSIEKGTADFINGK